MGSVGEPLCTVSLNVYSLLASVILTEPTFLHLHISYDKERNNVTEKAFYNRLSKYAVGMQ